MDKVVAYALIKCKKHTFASERREWVGGWRCREIVLLLENEHWVDGDYLLCGDRQHDGHKRQMYVCSTTPPPPHPMTYLLVSATRVCIEVDKDISDASRKASLHIRGSRCEVTTHIRAPA